MDGRRARRRHVMPAVIGLMGVALLAGHGSAQGLVRHARAASPATFTIRVDAQGRGTFTVRGGIVDQGRASVRRAVVNGRLNATETLRGSKGRIVLTSRQRCAGGAGTWRVVSGTLTYASLSGRGTTAGRVTCRPLGAASIVLRGTVELPPPALAQPGSWGGRTAQGSALLFEVTRDGRAIENVLVGGFRYECVRSDGLRSPASLGPDVVYRGPFAIADDRTFSFKPTVATIAGRFGAAGAEGTLTVAYSLPADAQGRTSTCSGTTSWTVTTPPPPAKQALAGTYCGFTNAGGGVCVDVTAGRQEARNLRAEIVLTCGIVARIPLRVSITYDQPMPLRTDLSFRGTFTQPFEGRSIGASLTGTFDESGGLSGTVGLAQPTIVRDGVTHICRSNGLFTARLQR